MNILEDLQVTILASSNSHATFQTNFGVSILALYHCDLNSDDRVDALYYWLTPCCRKEIPRSRDLAQVGFDFPCPGCGTFVAPHLLHSLNGAAEDPVDLAVLERAIVGEGYLDPLAAILAAQAFIAFMESHQRQVLELSGLQNATSPLRVAA